MIKLKPHKIQKYMALRGVTKGELADLTDMPITTVNRVLKGYACYDTTAGRIANALDVPEFEELVEMWGDEIDEERRQGIKYE